MRVDEWGYTKVNGIRVNAESYHRKVRKLERQNGRRSAIRTSLHGAPSAKCQSHAATLTLFAAEGRQVYPTLRWVSDCGVDVYDAQRIYGPSTCKRCNGRQHYEGYRPPRNSRLRTRGYHHSRRNDYD